MILCEFVVNRSIVFCYLDNGNRRAEAKAVGVTWTNWTTEVEIRNWLLQGSSGRSKKKKSSTDWGKMWEISSLIDHWGIKRNYEQSYHSEK